MKKFSELKAGDKIYSKLDDKYFEEEVLENFEFDCDEYVWELKTDLDCYYLTDLDMSKEFLVLENSIDIKSFVSTSMDKLLLEVSE